MLERFKTYLLYGSFFSSVEHSLKDHQAIIYGTVLKKSKKEVDAKRYFSLKTIEEIPPNLPGSRHIHLVINNDQVLTKTIKSEGVDTLSLVNKAFPNIGISEFYYQFIDQGHTSFISICRKKYIDDLIKAYDGHGIRVISFSLGNMGLTRIVPYIEDSQILTSNTCIRIQNKRIEAMDDIQPQKEVCYHINGLKVSNSHLLSFSGALSYLVGNPNSNANYGDKTNALFDDYKQIRFFNQFLKSGLVLILVMLLINFMCYNFYFNQVRTLDQTSQLNQTAKRDITVLSESVNKAKKTTDDLLNSSTSRSSFYMNALVNSLPPSILLSEINYQPLARNVKPDKPIEISQNTMIISGESSNKSQYSQWITSLEDMNWIHQVTIEAYNDSKSVYSNFSIKISMTP